MGKINHLLVSAFRISVLKFVTSELVSIGEASARTLVVLDADRWKDHLYSLAQTARALALGEPSGQVVVTGVFPPPPLPTSYEPRNGSLTGDTVLEMATSGCMETIIIATAGVVTLPI